MKHKFANYNFDDALRVLVRPDGVTCSLRPQINKFLALLISRSQHVFSKNELIIHIWGNDSSATDHDLQCLKRDLEKCLGNKELIRTVPRQGYAFTASLNATQPAASIVSSTDGGESSGSLSIFPGVGNAAGALFVHSFVAYGKNDYVKHLQKAVKWEKRTRHMVMLSEKLRSVLSIPFRHVTGQRTTKESWWAIGIPIRVDPVIGDWCSVDLMPYSELSFRIRSKSKSSKRGPILLRVRFEDESINSKSKSRRQSSSWYPEPLEIPTKWHRFTLALIQFRWSRDAWPGNTEAVRRDKIVQIVFGQDPTVPSASGDLEISD